MKTVLKVFLIVALVVILVIAMIGASITFLVAWTFGGYRFSPDEAAYVANASFRDTAYSFEVDGYYFYYKTDEGREDWIRDVVFVVKNEIGMYRPVYDDDHCRYLYMKETADWAGDFAVLEGENCYYNFYLAPPEGYLASEGRYDFVKDWDGSITVDGQKIQLDKHSYFVTETKITEFEVNGVTLTTEATPLEQSEA